MRKALDVQTWEAAIDLVRGWESLGQIGVVRPELPSIRAAVDKYIEDAEARNLSPESIKRIRDAVERLFLGFCVQEGLRPLRHITVGDIREYRQFLVKKYAASSVQARLEYARGFLRFCQQSGWIASNPAVSVKAPKSRSTPTL